MTGCIVFRWGGSVPGREAKSLEVFAGAIAYVDALAKEGRVHGHREYIAMSGGGKGMMVVDGDLEELQAIQREDEFRRLLVQSSAIVQEFDVQLYVGGSEQTLQEVIGNYGQWLSEMGYM